MGPGEPEELLEDDAVSDEDAALLATEDDDPVPLVCEDAVDDAPLTGTQLPVDDRAAPEPVDEPSELVIDEVNAEETADDDELSGGVGWRDGHLSVHSWHPESPFLQLK